MSDTQVRLEDIAPLLERVAQALEDKAVGSCWLTSRQAAAYCRCSWQHFRGLQSLGLTPGIVFNGERTYLYHTDDLDEWICLDRRTVEAAQAIVSRRRFQEVGRRPGRRTTT